jgi:enterochelin esterase-like enzyme
MTEVEVAPRPGRRDRIAGAAGAAVRRWGRTVVGVVAAVLVVVAIVQSGFLDDYNNTLQVMGFDPDRATLITALLVGAIAGAVVSLIGGSFRVAVLTGAIVGLVAFASVYAQETSAALVSTGSDGVFDPVGWVVTTLTLVVTVVVAAWAAAALAERVRGGVGRTWGALRDAAGSRTHLRRDGAVMGAALACVAVLAVTLPVLGDMLNFEPDAHMRVGGPAGVALFGDGSAASATASAPAAAPSASVPGPSSGAMAGTHSHHGSGTSAVTPASAPGPLVIPRDLVPGPVAGSAVTANALATTRPWTTQPPAGNGRTFSVNLPAPWTGGIHDYATIDIYLPPGYDNGTQRYPVIYEPHQPLWAWEQGMHVSSFLNDLIDTGAMPPEIVVFVGQYGGPYPDSECADSYDGREWFDRYLGHDVPAWVDANLRTIATPQARALLGFSAGGYCAAAAIAHHPDVFDTALIFSGYFQAGVLTSTTPTAGRPFNDSAALEAKVSPIDVVPKIPASQRQSLFIAFSADPANRFYGDQITAFANVLDQSSVSMAILPTPLGHSWAAVREQLPTMLGILAERQVKLGVFGTK